jgi:hypothetical protein
MDLEVQGTKHNSNQLIKYSNCEMGVHYAEPQDSTRLRSSPIVFKLLNGSDQ